MNALIDQDSRRRRTPLHGLIQDGYQKSEDRANECFNILFDHNPALPLDLGIKVMANTKLCMSYLTSYPKMRLDLQFRTQLTSLSLNWLKKEALLGFYRNSD